MRQREFLCMGRLHNKADTAIGVQQQAARGGRDTIQPIPGKRCHGGLSCGGGCHDAGALHTNLSAALPKRSGADIWDMRQQTREARCRRAVAVEYGIAGAGRAWRVVNANRVALCPGHIIFAIGGGRRVPRGKGGAPLHPHVARDDGRAVCLIQKGNGAIGLKLAQLEIRRVKDMAIVVVIGIRGSARKPHAETVQRWVDARATNEMHHDSGWKYSRPSPSRHAHQGRSGY